VLASAASQYYLQQLYFAIKMNKKNKGEKRKSYKRKEEKREDRVSYNKI